MKKPIYLDYNSTTPVDPLVLAAMLPYFSEKFGNPASNHPYGWQAKEGIDQARENIAQLIGAENAETLIFTSGATEGNNLALKGFCQAHRHLGKHIISQKTEHRSVLEPLQELEECGFTVTLLDCDAKGQIHPEQVARAITKETILVSVMYANNEIGTLQPISEIGQICKKEKVIFHSDAVQALGKVPVTVQDNQIDLMSLGAHKMYGPKGIGALYISPRRPAIRLISQMRGGGHERGLRSGTLAPALIVGFGEAARLAKENLQTEMPRILSLRKSLWQGLSREIPQIQLNGHPETCLPGTLNIAFEGLETENILEAFSGLALSSGSACTSAKREPSHVLTALGLSLPLIHSSLRFCLGRTTTEEEIQDTITMVVKIVKKLRSESFPESD